MWLGCLGGGGGGGGPNRGVLLGAGIHNAEERRDPMRRNE